MRKHLPGHHTYTVRAGLIENFTDVGVAYGVPPSHSKVYWLLFICLNRGLGSLSLCFFPLI